MFPLETDTAKRGKKWGGVRTVLIADSSRKKRTGQPTPKDALTPEEKRIRTYAKRLLGKEDKIATSSRAAILKGKKIKILGKDSGLGLHI